MYNVLNELKYTSNHTWIEELGEGNYRVGITDFAQNELGDIVFFEGPELERKYAQMDECAVVESVKSTSDIFCPLSGTIVEINPILKDSPEVINSDPYDEGWLFIVNANDEVELDQLIDSDAYRELTEGE